MGKDKKDSKGNAGKPEGDAAKKGDAPKVDDKAGDKKGGDKGGKKK